MCRFSGAPNCTDCARPTGVRARGQSTGSEHGVRARGQSTGSEHGGQTLCIYYCTLTFVNVAVAVADVVWLDTASPMYTLAPIEIVSVPTKVQVDPSGD